MKHILNIFIQFEIKQPFFRIIRDKKDDLYIYYLCYLENFQTFLINLLQKEIF